MRRYIKWIVAITGAAVLVLLLRCFAFSSFYIPAGSVDSSFQEGEGILVNKWSYGLRAPLSNLFDYHRWRERQVNRDDIVVFNNPANVIDALADKETFIGHCAGIPGDTLMVDSLFLAQSPQQLSSYAALAYYCYPDSLEEKIDSLMAALHIPATQCFSEDSLHNVRPFTRKAHHQIVKALACDSCLVPLEGNRQFVKPLIVPGKGISIDVYPWNRTLLMNTILLHEGKNAEIKNDTLFVDQQPVEQYTFSKDYYWMTTDKDGQMADSRLFGFVPHEYLIGKAALVWFSKDPEQPLFKGYRHNRFLHRLEQ